MVNENKKGKRRIYSNKELALMESQRRIQQEIATIKEDIRKAYSVQVRETQGYIPTEIEKKMILERDIANSVIERVSKSLSTICVMETPETSYRPDSTKTFSVLQFFYLVKLVQQSPSHMLSSLCPQMETSELIYISDTLMECSLKAAQERDIESRREYRHKVNTIMDKMTRGVNQPIDKGFKTTYYNIRLMLDALTDPEYASFLQEDLMPLIPPLSINAPPQMTTTIPFKLPQPTVPFPASLWNAYQNNINNQQDNKLSESKSVKKKKKNKKRAQNNNQKEEENKNEKDVVDKTEDDGDSKGVVKEKEKEKEVENDKKDGDTVTETNDEDNRFEDADDDQIIEVQYSHLDDLWEDIPSPNTLAPSDLPHSHWENFEKPNRTRRGLRPHHYGKDRNR